MLEKYVFTMLRPFFLRNKFNFDTGGAYDISAPGPGFSLKGPDYVTLPTFPLRLISRSSKDPSVSVGPFKYKTSESTHKFVWHNEFI